MEHMWCIAALSFVVSGFSHPLQEDGAGMASYMEHLAGISDMHGNSPKMHPQQNQIDVTTIQELAESMLNCWKIPGFSVAFTQKDQVTFSKAWGKRDVAKDLAANTQTAYHIGSITKHLTALAIAVSQDRGLFNLDTQLREHLGREFQLADPAASQATFRDVLTHRSGLAPHNGAWSLGGSPHEVVTALRYLEPSEPFRYRGVYNNWGYVLAAAALEKATATPWPSLMKRDVFDVIGMPNTYTSYTEATKKLGDQVTLSYDISQGAVKAFPPGNNQAIERVCPAGCIISTVEDLARALITQMKGGGGGGLTPGTKRRLLKLDTLLEYQRPMEAFANREMGYKEEVAGAIAGAPAITAHSYGAGLWVGTYRGYKLLIHKGEVAGGTSCIVMLPDIGISGVILANRGQTGDALPNFLFATIDMLLGVPRDQFWWDSGKSCAFSGDNLKAQTTTYLKPTPPQWVYSPSDYIGQYKHPMYGAITVNVVDSDLQLVFNNDSTTTARLQASGRLDGSSPTVDFFVGNATLPCCFLDPVPFTVSFPRDDRKNVIAVASPLEPALLNSPIMFTNSKFESSDASKCRGKCALRNLPSVYGNTGVGDNMACIYMEKLYKCLLESVCPIPKTMCERFQRCSVQPPSCALKF